MEASYEEQDLDPIIAILSLDDDSDDLRHNKAKALAASLVRSLFKGRVFIFRLNHYCIFKIGRTQITEVQIPPSRSTEDNIDHYPIAQMMRFEISQFLRPSNNQWVVVVTPGGLALRNIDHLLPNYFGGTTPPDKVDFYWTEGSHKNFVSQHFWAVRGEYLPYLLNSWKGFTQGETYRTIHEIEEKWSNFVRALPISSKRIEKGEVYSPTMGAVDWESVRDAAYVSLAHWPQVEQRTFQQALYFGTYFGGKSGVMLDLMEP